MEKRSGRRRKEESFEATADPTPITTSRITTRRKSVTVESAISGRTSRGSITTEKTATRTSARNRSKLISSAASAVPPTVLESPIKEADENAKSTPVKVSSKASVTRIIPVVVEPTNDEGRNSVSRQSTASGGTVDLTSAVNNGSVKNEINSRLVDFIHQTANVAETLRRSISRQRSTTPSTTATESRYSHSIFDGENDYSNEYSNEEDHGEYVSTKSELFLSSMEQEYLCRPREVPREFGGPWGIAMLLIVLPILVTYIIGNTFITDDNILRVFMPKGKSNMSDLLQHIFPGDVVAAFLCFHMGIFVLSGSLFGLLVRLPRVNHFTEMKFNALPMAICLNLIWIVAANYTHFNVVDYVLKNQWRFFIYSVIYAFITAIWAHLRAIYNPVNVTEINVYGKTGNFIVDFAIGRNLNPQWLNLIDLKQYCYRAQLMLTLLIAECYLISCLPNIKIEENWRVIFSQTYWQNINWTSGTLLAAAMLIHYITDAIIFEHHLASSFELQCEGFGALLLLRYAVTPFLLSGIVRNCHLKNINADWYDKIVLFVSVLLFFTGIIWKRLSSASKYKYRLNPTHSYFDNIDTIHTFQGRRLLVDKFWGTLRQPNYAGDILALICLCIPFIFSIKWQAHLGILLIIIMLLHRATRANKRNYQRYHSSWSRYVGKVPYYIIPKIF